LICVVCGACAQTNCCRAPKQTYAAARHREHVRYRHNCPAQRDTESNQECLVPPRSAQASLQPCGTTGSCGTSQKKGRRKSAHLCSAGKNSSLTMMKRNRKRKRTKRSKKKAHCGQSVRYRSWWKQGSIKMAVSEDHASCWAHKDLTVTTK